MSNEELIAEAREAQSVAFNDNEVGYALIIRALADALEAQSAPPTTPGIYRSATGEKWELDHLGVWYFWGTLGRIPDYPAGVTLTAQSAPLVADSREALANVLARKTGHGISQNYRGGYICKCGAEWDWTRSERDAADLHIALARADALLASGLVSLAADRDRAMKAQGWDEGFKQGGPMHDVNYDDPDAHTRNPYRESEGK